MKLLPAPDPKYITVSTLYSLRDLIETLCEDDLICHPMVCAPFKRNGGWTAVLNTRLFFSENTIRMRSNFFDVMKSL